MQYAEVAVDVPRLQTKTFTYAIPAGLEAAPGHAVWVPFGNRTRRGLVFEVMDWTELEETRDIARLIDETPLLSDAQLHVARWIASYYRVDLFAAAALMLPPGFSETARTLVRPAPDAASRTLSEREARALALAAPSGGIRRDRLARRLGFGGAETVDRLLRRGVFTAETVWERPRTGPAYRPVVRLAMSDEEARRAADGQRSGRRRDLIRYLLDRPEGSPRRDLTDLFGGSAVRGLLNRGVLAMAQARVERDPLRDVEVRRSVPLRPNRHQGRAIGSIVRAMHASTRHRDRKPQAFLLHGVTASGKTEVYLQAVEACLRAGKAAIVLVPEIALTPQHVQRFANRFEGRIALLHSGLTDGERFDQWWAIRRGEVPIVLGSRSGIFAPLADVGLVVLDEEHEWTYKQHDASPRYDTRAVAEKLCEAHGAVLVAGSATPRVESFYKAERGEWGLLELPERIARARLATRPRSIGEPAHVQVVDMREELRAGHSGIFSRSLERGLAETFQEGGRAILFLNRRGTAAFVQCRECGDVRNCRRCDTALTLHKGSEPDEPARLICHYCNARVRYSPACRVCGALTVRPSGLGTERVVEEMARLFPDVGVLRWDRDAARTAREHTEILERFTTGAYRALVGTQMVAKGLDIPSVRLAGVVSADTGLAIPDFRAGERTFQVLTQVIGRTGRGGEPGLAVIQTFQPGHYAVQAAATQSVESFYAEEIELRRAHANPPFTRMIRLGYAHPDPERARSDAFDFAARIQRERTRIGEAATEIVGPTPSFPTRVRGLTRWHILLKGVEPGALLDRVTAPRRWAIDVDPVTIT